MFVMKPIFFAMQYFLQKNMHRHLHMYRHCNIEVSSLTSVSVVMVIFVVPPTTTLILDTQVSTNEAIEIM